MPAFCYFRLTAIAALAATIGMSACGRRGNLEPSPDSGISPREARELAKSAEDSQTDALEGTRRVRNVVPPKDPFILDPLL